MEQKSVLKKIYVWPLCIRTFHWFYALSFVAAFSLVWFENLLTLHVATGMAFLFLAIFRLVWGLIGPLYSNFHCFDFKGDHLLNYILHLIGYKEMEPGHNPGASWGAILMLVLGLLIGLSGLFLYGIQEGRGVFASLNALFYPYMDALSNLHAVLTYLMSGVVVIHIVGVTLSHILHRNGIIWSMFTGYKYAAEGRDVALDFKQNIFAVIFLTSAVGIPFYIIEAPDNIIVKSRFEPIDYKKENPLLAKECGSCHIVYPAYLLPKRGWDIVMTTPHDHYGADLNTSEADLRTLQAYLVDRSSEHSMREAAVKLLKSVEKKKYVYSIIGTPYWREVHKGIDKKVFHRKSVRSKYHCESCHTDIKQAMIEDDAIRLPGTTAMESIRMHIYPRGD